jgi:hypothetical protein
MNAHKSDYQLARRAVQLFPQTTLSDPAAVRHARRKWIEAIKYLRDRPGPSAWVLDTVTERKTPAPPPPRMKGFSAWQIVQRHVIRGAA